VTCLAGGVRTIDSAGSTDGDGAVTELRVLTVGVIADTHGLLRPEAVERLAGSNLIVHAGDVGKPSVLDALRAVAPVVAVRGNVDAGRWADGLPATAIATAGSHRLYVVHDLADLRIDPGREGCSAVICGHTHRPRAEWREGVLFLNPGAAGPRRFRLPVTLARLIVNGPNLSHEILELSV
jgi:putative phosphoesterase